MLILSALPGTGTANRTKVTVEKLFHEHYPAVFGFFSRRGCSREDSQDLAQETFLRAHKAIDGFRGESKPLTWLLTIATNVWLNRLRDAVADKRQGKEVPLPDSGQGHPLDARQEDHLIDLERRRLLREAIDKLPLQMRRCVLLRVYQNMSYREIAEILEIAEKTARSQYSRARERLGSLLEEHYPGLTDDPDDRRTRR